MRRRQWYVIVLLISIMLGNPQLIWAEEQPAVPNDADIAVPQIVGGNEAIPNEFPWQILLTYGGLNASCGGSVIHESWILTAAHCVYGEDPSWRTVVAGIHDRTSDAANPHLQRRTVKRIIIHPNYNDYTLDYDMALLELSSPLVLNSKVTAIYLAGNSDNTLYNAGTVLTVSGWGHTSWRGSSAIRLQKVNVPVVSSATCSGSYGSITDRMFCAGNFVSGGIDSCQGDSGGPIFVNHNGRYVLTGVVSSGNECAKPRYPGIYTHVANLRPWVESIAPIGPESAPTTTPYVTSTMPPTHTASTVAHALVEVASGASFSLGLMRNGGLVTWGHNRDGQTTIPRWLANVPMRHVSVGSNYAAAVSMTGRVYVWGANTFNQRSVPVSAQSDVIAVSAGMRHVLALKQNGQVVAWGGNNLGQARVPRKLTNVIAIAAGHSHSLALLDTGKVVAWGDNSVGQLRVPATLKNVVAISAGFDHSLALTASGRVIAWGNNTHGQRSVPRMTRAVAISAGQYFSLALLDNGKVVAWGRNSFGQSNIPANVSNVVSISAGYQNSVLGLRNGKVLVYGSADFGARVTRTPTITGTATQIPTATYTPTQTATQTGTATRTPLPSWMTSIPNGDFENGGGTWTESSLLYPAVITDDIRNSARSGRWYAWMGGNNNEVSTLSQTIFVPASASYLRFYYNINTSDTCGNDSATISIGGSVVHTIDLCTSTTGWTAADIDITAHQGTNVLLSFYVTTNATRISHFLLDDVGFVANTSDDLYYSRVNLNQRIVRSDQLR